MELFSTMGTTELNDRLHRYGKAPHPYLLLASVWRKMPAQDMADFLFQVEKMLEELENEVVSLSAQLIAAGVES